MLDRGQLKTEGVRFARSLQLVFKTVSMFSGTHAAVQGPLQSSYDLLTQLLKGTRQFTVGFVDDRVLINNILTNERTLQPLEAEFMKRGIGAITFESGITLTAYKRVLSVLSASPREIETQGGMAKYLQANPVEFARIFPTSDNRPKVGDTVLDVDSESFLMAKAMGSVHPQGSAEWLAQQTGTAVVDMRTGVGLPGTGFAVPGAGEGGAVGGTGAEGEAASGASPRGIESIVQSYFNGALTDPNDTKARSFSELVRLIQETRPEFVLQNFSPTRREELRNVASEQIAHEVIEDSAARWAAERLSKAPSGAEGLIVEEEVIRVLLRSLQATQAVNRMMNKLAEQVRNMQMPPSTLFAIREELEWAALPRAEKVRRLLNLQHFSRREFRRLTDLLLELARAGEKPDMAALAANYFRTLDAQDRVPEPEELGRIPELLGAVKGLDVRFWQETAARICTALDRWHDRPFHHQQLLNSLVVVCNSLALYEDFSLVESVGKSVERLATEDAAHHAHCCGAALGDLLPLSSVDRVVESYMQRCKDDHGWARTCQNLLRRSGKPGVEKVFQRLEGESSTSGRLGLLRLIGRMGDVSIQLARERLSDPRWYVVRNACKLLGELKDPELPSHIAPALRHDDERVQKAAVSAIIDSRHPKRAGVLAENLAALHPEIVEQVVTELMFLRDPVCLPALEQLIFRDSHGSKTSIPCVQTLTAIGGPEAELILLRVLCSTSLDAAVRRAAINPLLRSTLGSTQQALSAFTLRTGYDPVREETRLALYAAGKR